MARKVREITIVPPLGGVVQATGFQQTKGMTSLPTANDYLYIVNGEAAGGTFSAGKFIIELFGV